MPRLMADQTKVMRLQPGQTLLVLTLNTSGSLEWTYIQSPSCFPDFMHAFQLSYMPDMYRHLNLSPSLYCKQSILIVYRCVRVSLSRPAVKEMPRHLVASPNNNKINGSNCKHKQAYRPLNNLQYIAKVRPPI